MTAREIIEHLSDIHKLIPRGTPAYVAGGTVRDWLLRQEPADIDIVVPKMAFDLAFRASITLGGTFVPLDQDLGIARLVVHGITLDFTRFRGNATDIRRDLVLRDFSINAMAVSLENIGVFLESLEESGVPRGLIDPADGLSDLGKRTVRAIGKENLRSDPLRMLRAYRFMAQLGFELDPETRSWISDLSDLIHQVAAERIEHEFALVMKSDIAHLAFEAMARDGLLTTLIPEISAMDGVEQPGFHHLDVLGHSIETLHALEALLKDPALKFKTADPLKDWVNANAELIPYLKWAALLHDVGKPSTQAEREGRATFYHHDATGSEIVGGISRRLRWPRRQADFTARLVRLHMRPFFLLRDLRTGGPTPRAMRRLAKEIEGAYPALFLLSMADSMAGCGPLKPAGLDDELSALWDRFHGFYTNLMKPVLARPRLLTGRDLQEIFGLAPGPVIGQGLDALDEARVEGEISTREDAIRWMEKWLSSRDSHASC